MMHLYRVYQRTQKEKREGEVECGHKHYIYMMEDSGQVGDVRILHLTVG